MTRTPPRPDDRDDRVMGLGGFGDRLASVAMPAADHRAWLVRLGPGEFRRFERLCRRHHIRILDTLARQLTELAAVRDPGVTANRSAFAAELLASGGGPIAFGCWVYLPWASRVAHLLAEEDYVEVVTSRNRDKITVQEQRLLRTRRVGVLGLSVGGEAAVALAQEHLCGELRLADFDHLDLSNLNRVGAGFDDLGLNKAVIAARRIARIDPYLRVTVVPEGITEDNLDAFLDGLDLLVEECDGLDMKRLVRQRARERGVNVVYAADERGFLSIEPYGQRPGLDVFHGLVPRLHPPRSAFASDREFLRALTEWLGGWDRLSERSRQSLERIGTTVCGYPQLASEARYAAGQIGHAARRLLLDEPLGPFVGNLDLADLLPRTPTTARRGTGGCP